MKEINIDKTILNKEIGHRVREMREYHKFTREKLAEYADISVQFLASIETGQKSMTTHTLYKISKALNVSADYLLTGHHSSSENSKISLMLDTLTEDEKFLAEHLLQTYLRGLSLRESSAIQKYHFEQTKTKKS